MELTHVPVQGPNTSPPPRLPQAVRLPLDRLWTAGIDPKTRQKVLQILSRVAARQLTAASQAKEADNE